MIAQAMLLGICHSVAFLCIQDTNFIFSRFNSACVVLKDPKPYVLLPHIWQRALADQADAEYTGKQVLKSVVPMRRTFPVKT